LVPMTIGQAIVRTLHVLVGSWILATAVSCAALSHLAKQPRLQEVVENDQAYPPLRVTAAPETAVQGALALHGVEHREGRA
jgi:hypothetical protein